MQDLGPSVFLFSSPVAFGYACRVVFDQRRGVASVVVWLWTGIEFALFGVLVAASWYSIYALS